MIGQAFVFAKGALEDAGFAWHVVGSVHGYAVNRVVTQNPTSGTKLKDTGAPTITLTLARTSYPETGEPEDLSPYIGTAVVTAARPLVTKPVVQKPAVRPKPALPKPAVKPKPVSKKPAARPPAFAVRGAPKEPLKEMPLTSRAHLLSAWLSTHRKPTNATVRHFLYQNAWVVTGARFGWWHGAQALRLLIATDMKAQRIWGIGHRSELAARHALAEVEARSR